MLSFGAPLFALAGILAAAGPVIVHLLNRRRFRVVAWGAMEFLRQAVQRQRNAVQLRDLLLLMLRVLVVLLFGLALARPYLQGMSRLGALGAGVFLLLCLATAVCAAATATITERQSRLWAGLLTGCGLVSLLGLWGWSSLSSERTGVIGSSAKTPVHAILVIDNSRSMGTESTAGTRLDQAKQLARQFIATLPADSRITLIPNPGLEIPFPSDAFTNANEAGRALDEITVVDAADDMAVGLELAEAASQQLTEPETKRVVILSDWQGPHWKQLDWVDWAKRLPGLQLAQLDDGAIQNVSIASWSLEDGIAGAESDTRFLARIQAQGITTPLHVTATLRIDDVTIASQVVDLADDQIREVEFWHRFEISGEPGRPRWSTATLELRPDDPGSDRLSADNMAAIMVPVLDAVPVVFIDEVGSAEDVSRGRIGETYALRHLLSPRTASDDAPRRLIHIEHVRPDDVTTQLLESARLVVIAGVASPETMVAPLLEYVMQGGPLVILAGGEFDPVAWQTWAWKDGRGIVPLPLDPLPLGALPTATAELHPFFVDFSSLQHRDFLIESEDPETLAGLFSTTPFFKAARVAAGGNVIDNQVAAQAAALTSEVQLRESPSASDATALRSSEPTWWLWRNSVADASAGLSPAQVAERERPHVLARFTESSAPWVIERRIGAGTVLFFSSGVTSDWNLLRSSSAMYVFHRALFRLLTETLSQRNFTTGERFVWPRVPSGHLRFQMERPSGLNEPLSVEALAANLSGLVARRTYSSGIYRIHSESTAAAASDSSSESTVVAWATQAPSSESQLAGATPAELRAAMNGAAVGVLENGEPIRLEGGSRRGEHLWKWSIAAALLGLFSEMLLLSHPMWRRGTA